MSDKVKKYGSLILKLIVSITIFTIVYRKVTNRQSLDLFSELTAPLFFLMFFTGVFQTTINAFIQQKLLLMYHLTFSFMNQVMHNFISTMYLLIIPGFFAPDFYLGYYYGKQKSNYGRVISALFINRAIGFLTFLLLATIAILAMGSSLISKIHFESTSINLRFWLIIIFGLLLMIIIVWFFLKKQILKIVNNIIQIWNETRNHKKLLWGAFFLKLGFNITGLAGRLGIGYLLNINIPFLQFACIVFILNFLISLPISLNGVGVREAGYVGLFAIMGVPESSAFLFALCEFGITLLSALIGAVLYLGIQTNKLHISLKNK